jgi:ParB/RepB/Spo0J family partition protein
MNAPTAPAAPAALTAAAFSLIHITALAPSGTRTQERRRRRFGKQEQAELAASIKAVGIVQPIVARPHPRPADGFKYEIVAGERRWLAAVLAGLAEVPALVREVADADLVQFQLTENLQRKTIDALEEAEGYDELRKEKKLTADQVADLMGISRATVFNRLKLLDLCPEARAALEQGRLTPSNAMLIARIGHHDTQRKALKDSGTSDYAEGAMSYRELRDHIENTYMIELKRAPFKLDDAALLPKAGACAQCPKRSGNQKDLFHDVKNPNVCTDPKCFDDKRQIAFSQAAAALDAKGRKVIAGNAAKKIMPHWEGGGDYVSGGYTKLSERNYDREGKGRSVAQILGPDHQPTLIQHPGTGKIIEIASNQAVAAALSGRKPKEERSTAKARKAAPAARGLDLPDLDDQVTERLIKLIHEKAPAKFSRGILLSLVKIIFPEINTRGEKLALIAKQYGWLKTAFKSGGYSRDRHLPKEALGFAEPGLVRLLLHLVFAAHWSPHGNPSVLDFLGINAQKTREAIIGERKAAVAAARMKARLQKASPIVKGKKR